MGVGRRGLASQDLEIWHFSIKFLAKKTFFWFRVGKMKFHYFSPWKKYFSLCVEKSAIAPPTPSDAHVYLFTCFKTKKIQIVAFLYFRCMVLNKILQQSCKTAAYWEHVHSLGAGTLLYETQKRTRIAFALPRGPNWGVATPVLRLQGRRMLISRLEQFLQ